MKSTIRSTFIKMTVLASLSLGLFFTSCSKKDSTPPPDKTSINAAIDSAKWYSTNTNEGTKPGEYTTGAKTALNSALASAQSIVADASSTQAVLTNAAANLQAAITAYKATFIQQIAVASLVAFWKFNGNANDSSGNGHNGTLEAGPVGLSSVPGGVPNSTNDRFGNASAAYHFAGGGNIDVPYSPSLNPPAMSISLWERQDTAGRTDHFSDYYMIAMNRWNGWKFQMQPTRPFFTVNTDSADYDRDGALDLAIGTTVGSGSWYHLVVTYDGAGTEVFYVNGTMVKTWTNLKGAAKQFTPTIDISIGSDLPNSAYTPTDDGTGRYFVTWGGYWTGDLDDVMFYNIALTGPQVASIYTNQNTQ